MIAEQNNRQTFKDLALIYVNGINEFWDDAQHHPKYSIVLYDKFCNHLRHSLIDFAVATGMVSDYNTASYNLSKAIFIEKIN